ncbi:3-hydroxyacyl-ACP dehydratase [Thaumasiovibrio sp. DFM-14]|uniref:ApeI family dehydratase n=1 Tax=Thaumasiovibrio sp. DFM-14 TaxID=3384792 RepID=UPI0039A3B40F
MGTRDLTILSLQHSDITIASSIRFPAHLPDFKGHFPTAPILPGVSQIDYVMQLATKYLPISGDFSQIDKLKFQLPLSPEKTIKLSIHWLPEQQALTFIYTSDAGVHSSGRILLSNAFIQPKK